MTGRSKFVAIFEWVDLCLFPFNNRPPYRHVVRRLIHDLVRFGRRTYTLLYGTVSCFQFSRLFIFTGFIFQFIHCIFYTVYFHTYNHISILHRVFIVYVFMCTRCFHRPSAAILVNHVFSSSC